MGVDFLATLSWINTGRLCEAWITLAALQSTSMLLLDWLGGRAIAVAVSGMGFDRGEIKLLGNRLGYKGIRHK